MTTLLTLDFETYWSKDYSLSRMTTEEYVRDERFRAHMVGFKVGDGRSAWTTDVNAFCRKVDWSRVACVAQHAQFDGLILNHKYGVRPALWIDTLSMARIVIPGEKHSLHALARRFGLPTVEKRGLSISFGKYALAQHELVELGADCVRDVELTHAIALRLLPHVPRDELKVIDLTIRMFTEPELVGDAQQLEQYRQILADHKAEVLEHLGVDEKTLQSSEKFAELLRRFGVEPPMKSTQTSCSECHGSGIEEVYGGHGTVLEAQCSSCGGDGKNKIYAFAKTDDGMRELAEHHDGRVQALAAARLGVKSTINETRATRLRDMAHRGPLCVYLKHAGAHTGRWSGGDSLNWQNFVRGGMVRKSVQAPPGRKLVVGDLSQIECRVVNWLAGQHDVLDAFRGRRDLYSELASRYYGRAVTKADPVERHLGKTIELGCGFGMGADRFRDTCRRGPLGGEPIILSETEAKQAVDLYRSTHQAVVAYWRSADTAISILASDSATEMPWGPMVVKSGQIMLPGGYPLWYRQWTVQDGERFYWDSRKWQKMYGAKLVENVTQALAGIILKQAMLRIDARGYRPKLTVHDDVMVLAQQDDTAALGVVLEELTRVPEWAAGLPLDAEGMEGLRYEK